ncbi:MAG TPA: hypothetical protein VNH18_09895 [Bryobacteraceae bacterium]|nr:hypothetical protein [Bryobacteraceae bacterium]
MQAYSDNRDKVLASVALPQRSPDIYGRTIRAMREKKLTFEEAINSRISRCTNCGTHLQLG